MCRRADHYRAGLSDGLQARRDVRRFAKGQFLLPAPAADLAHHYEAGVNSDAQGQGDIPFTVEARIQGLHRRENAQGGPPGTLWVVLVSDRVAEVDEEAVAEILGDVAVEAIDHSGADFLIAANDLAQDLGVEPRREIRRANEVTKHDGELPALGRTGRPGALRQRRLRRQQRLAALLAELVIGSVGGSAASAAENQNRPARRTELGVGRGILLAPGTLHAVNLGRTGTRVGQVPRA